MPLVLPDNQELWVRQDPQVSPGTMDRQDSPGPQDLMVRSVPRGRLGLRALSAPPVR